MSVSWSTTASVNKRSRKIEYRHESWCNNCNTSFSSSKLWDYDSSAVNLATVSKAETEDWIVVRGFTGFS